MRIREAAWSCARPWSGSSGSGSSNSGDEHASSGLWDLFDGQNDMREKMDMSSTAWEVVLFTSIIVDSKDSCVVLELVVRHTEAPE
jgi:hypothetical protein